MIDENEDVDEDELLLEVGEVAAVELEDLYVDEDDVVGVVIELVGLDSVLDFIDNEPVVPEEIVEEEVLSAAVEDVDEVGVEEGISTVGVLGEGLDETRSELDEVLTPVDDVDNGLLDDEDDVGVDELVDSVIVGEVLDEELLDADGVIDGELLNVDGFIVGELFDEDGVAVVELLDVVGVVVVDETDDVAEEFFLHWWS